MDRKSQWSDIKWILIGLILLIAIVVAFVPSIKKLLFTDIGPVRCEETGLTLSSYQEEIRVSLEKLDIVSSSDEYKKQIVEYYKEFAECFPENDFDVYAENNFGEQETFKFIFLVKEQKHYDKITLKIAQRYLTRFPASIRRSDVNAYIDEAKAALD